MLSTQTDTHSFNDVLRYFNRWPKSSLYLSTFFMLMGMAFIDFISSYYLSLFLFYLLPILFASVTLGRNTGFLVSVASILIWFGAEVYTKPTTVEFMPWIVFWNGMIRLVVFAVLVLVSSALVEVMERERTYARTDFLTGAANSQGFFESSGRELKRCNKTESPVSLAYFDCDNFKSVNDTHGHRMGSKCLQIIGQTMLEHCRKTDVVSRVGGDEFVILLPDTDIEQARKAVEKLRGVLLDEMKKNGWPVTFSVGVVTYKCPHQSLEEMVMERLLREADELMYKVKSKGKNNAEYHLHEEDAAVFRDKPKDLSRSAGRDTEIKHKA